MPDDATLLQRYAETGAEDAFAELVRRHIDGVFSAAVRRVGGDVQLAEDVAQQVFVVLARNAAALTGHPALTVWLYVTTRNAAGNVVRQERRRKAREREAQTMQQILSEGESPADWSRVAPVLDAAIDELSETDRTAVLLRFVDRRGFAQIGMALNVSEDAARMRVERALGKLHALLARRGVTSTAGALAVALTEHAALAAPAGVAASVTGGALTSAATGVGAAGMVTGFTQFMSMSKIVGGTAVLAFAALMVTAIDESRAGREAETARAAAQRENEALAARLRDLQQRADAAEKSREAALKAAAAPRPAPAPAAPRRDPAAEADALLARHPEVKEALIGYQRASLRATYEPLFRALRLTSEQIDRCVEALLLQGSQRQVTGPDGALRFKLAGNPAEAERVLREVLGDEGFKHYRDFVSDLTSLRATASLERNQIATTPLELASALHQTATPLDAAQGERLRQILEASLVPVEWSDRRQFDWDKIAAEARGFLSAPQLAMLERQGLSDRYLQEMNRYSFQQRQARAGATPTNR